jgi:spore coat-associated protein N
MSRLQVLVSQPRRALGALLTLMLAAAAVVGSGANFTASSANPENTFAAGTLEMVNSKDGQAVLTASGLRPGGPAQTGTVDIENSGSLSGDFTLGRSALVDSDAANPMSEKLNLTVRDCGEFAGGTAPDCSGGSVVYSGTLAAMGDSALGNYAGGEKHRYEFSVTLDGSAGNPYQGDSSSVTFDFDAVS